MNTSLVTVVTPCFNSGKTLEATIQSVLTQTYPYIEYIIMDGGSTDETSDIAERYKRHLSYISEPDTGQSNAINKGWKQAKGNILAWLNADDQYLPDTVERAVKSLESNSEAMWVYGSAVPINERGELHPFRFDRDDWDYSALVNQSCFINQPSAFLRRQIIEEFGYLDETLHFCMDYEYWLRIGRKYPPYYDPAIQARVIRSGITKSESGGVPRILELEQMTRKYGSIGLPVGIRHEWTMAYIERYFSDLRHLRLKDAGVDFKQIWRYPSTVPRSIGKVFIRLVIPRRLETKLRQGFVR